MRQLPSRPLASAQVPPPPLDLPLLVKSIVTMAGVVAAFAIGLDLAWSALAGAAFLLLIAGDRNGAPLGQVNWLLLLFFAGLFVVVYGVGRTGVAADLFAGASAWGGGNVAAQAIALSAASIVGSNLFSNVPFVLLAAGWIPSFADPPLAWKVLALSSTLAGNLTIVGSVANLIVLELAGAKGRVSFWRFLAYGLPITLVSTAIGLAVLLAIG